MATQQPMASDLRFLAGVLHIATDLERMGDHARSIARLTIKLGDEPALKPLAELPPWLRCAMTGCRGRWTLWWGVIRSSPSGSPSRTPRRIGCKMRCMRSCWRS